MKKLILYLALLIFKSVWVSAQSITGEWVTIHDDGVTKKSLIAIYQEGDSYSAKVIKVYDVKPDNPQSLCRACNGDKKDQPIEGMQILRGLQKDGNGFDDGKILDPESGKEYSCSMKLQDDGTLKVRGYIGFSLLGRSQTWYRPQ